MSIPQKTLSTISGVLLAMDIRLALRFPVKIICIITTDDLPGNICSKFFAGK